MPAKQHTVLDSPYGPLTLVATDGVLSALYMTGQRHRPPEETFGVPDPEPFGEVIRQLTAYFAERAHRLRPPAAPARHPVPAERLGGAGQDPVRRDAYVR